MKSACILSNTGPTVNFRKLAHHKTVDQDAHIYRLICD